MSAEIKMMGYKSKIASMLADVVQGRMPSVYEWHNAVKGLPGAINEILDELERLREREDILVNGMTADRKYGDDLDKAINGVYSSVSSVVCEFYEIEPANLSSKDRQQKYVDARGMVAVIIREIMKEKASLTWIGNKMGGRDHSTVIHYINKHEDLVKYDRYYRDDYTYLYDKCLVAVSELAQV